MTSLAERMHIIHKETGKSFAELARIAGASKSAAQQWKDGTTTSISGEYAIKLEDELGYSARWIINGSGFPRIAEVREAIGRHAIVEGINRGELIDISRIDNRGKVIIQTTIDTFTNEGTNKTIHNG